MNTMRYLVFGGKMVNGYKGPACVGIVLLGYAERIEGARQMQEDQWDECGGIVEIFDTQAGEMIG